LASTQLLAVRKDNSKSNAQEPTEQKKV
jgi:hypothetical protein